MSNGRAQQARRDQAARAAGQAAIARLIAQGYGNLRPPRPAYASDPSIIEGEFKVVADGR